MFNEEVAKLLDFSKAVCVKPTETVSLGEQDILDRLSVFPEVKKNTIFVVNDQYRATPCAMIIRKLRKLGKINCPLGFIIATGSHEPPTSEEEIALTDAKPGDRIVSHDVYTLKEYSNAGTTSRGTEVLYNPALDDYEHVITIGSVEPHYFAGFTGGAKSLMPGIASKKTITQNHRWATDPNAAQMKARGNPVFEDIWESGNLIRPLDDMMTVQLVNHGDTIMHLSAGLMRPAFEEARVKAEEFFGKKFKKKFDRIITFAQPPLDKNLYQSQKACDNTKAVLKKGGSLVLVAECSKGIGTISFFDRLSKLGSAHNVLKELSFEKYQLGDHKAISLARMSLDAELYYVGGLTKEVAATTYMKKISMEDLAACYKKWIAAGESVLIDEAGGFTTYYYQD